MNSNPTESNVLAGPGSGPATPASKPAEPPKLTEQQETKLIKEHVAKCAQAIPRNRVSLATDFHNRIQLGLNYLTAKEQQLRAKIEEVTSKLGTGQNKSDQEIQTALSEPVSGIQFAMEAAYSGLERLTRSYRDFAEAEKALADARKINVPGEQ